MDLETNGPPTTSPMNISPENGFALLTPFIIKTSPAEDKDGPLLYSFGIIIDKMTFVLNSGYDLYETEIHLPYSGKFIQTFLLKNHLIRDNLNTLERPIKTFYEVCDVYKSCSIQNGPEVSVNISSELNFDFARSQLDSIESGLDRGEYNASLNNIMILGLTLKVSVS